MKKLFFISLVSYVTLLAVSCKKEPPIGTISANIDGTNTSFKVAAKASVLSVQNGYGIQISGYKKDASATSLQLVIVRPITISPGTYTENTADNPLVQMKYFYDLFFGAGVGYSNHHSTTNPATVNITDISATSVKGTFQGELEGSDLSGGGIIRTQITNGVFNVSF